MAALGDVVGAVLLCPLGKAQLDVGSEPVLRRQGRDGLRQGLPQGAVAVLPGLGDRQIHTAQAAVGDREDGLPRQRERHLVGGLIAVEPGLVLVDAPIIRRLRGHLVLRRPALRQLIGPQRDPVGLRLLPLGGLDLRLQYVDVRRVPVPDPHLGAPHAAGEGDAVNQRIGPLFIHGDGRIAPVGAVAAVDPHLPYQDAAAVPRAVGHHGPVVAGLRVPLGLVGGKIVRAGGVLQQQILVLLAIPIEFRQAVEPGAPDGAAVRAGPLGGGAGGDPRPLGSGHDLHRLTVPGKGEIRHGAPIQGAPAGDLVQLEGQRRAVRRWLDAAGPLLDHLIVQSVRQDIGDPGPAVFPGLRLDAVGHLPAVLEQREALAVPVQQILPGGALVHGGLRPAVLQDPAQSVIGRSGPGGGPELQVLLRKAGLGDRDVHIRPCRWCLPLRGRGPGLEREHHRHVLQLALEGGGVPGLFHHRRHGVGEPVGEGAAVVDVAVPRLPVRTVVRHGAVRVRGAQDLLIAVRRPAVGRRGVQILPHHIEVAVALRIVLVQLGGAPVRVCKDDGLGALTAQRQDIGVSLPVGHRGGGGVGRPLPVAPELEFPGGADGARLVQPDLGGAVPGAAGQGQIDRAAAVGLREDGAHVGRGAVVVLHLEIVAVLQDASQLQPVRVPVPRPVHAVGDGGAVQVVLPAAGHADGAPGGVLRVRGGAVVDLQDAVLQQLLERFVRRVRVPVGGDIQGEAVHHQVPQAVRAAQGPPPHLDVKGDLRLQQVEPASPVPGGGIVRRVLLRDGHFPVAVQLRLAAQGPGDGVPVQLLRRVHIGVMHHDLSGQVLINQGKDAAAVFSHSGRRHPVQAQAGHIGRRQPLPGPAAVRGEPQLRRWERCRVRPAVRLIVVVHPVDGLRAQVGPLRHFDPRRDLRHLLVDGDGDGRGISPAAELSAHGDGPGAEAVGHLQQRPVDREGIDEALRRDGDRAPGPLGQVHGQGAVLTGRGRELRPLRERRDLRQHRSVRQDLVVPAVRAPKGIGSLREGQLLRKGDLQPEGRFGLLIGLCGKHGSYCKVI